MFLDVKNPVAFGSMATPRYYMEMRYQLQQAMESVPGIFLKIAGEFSGIFGRVYGPLEEYRTDDAETVVICAGTMAGTARIVIDSLREQGRKTGLLKIRMFRPFPYREMSAMLDGKKIAVVIDRNLSPGMGGIFAQEIRAALYGIGRGPRVVGVITGLGGRDITPDAITKIINDAENSEAPDSPIVWEGLENEDRGGKA